LSYLSKFIPKRYAMSKDKTPEQNLEIIGKFYEQMEKEKEDCLIDFIVEIIVSSTMREYYESMDCKDKHESSPKQCGLKVKEF
jgi:abortive infection bacteriophage resistance protein